MHNCTNFPKEKCAKGGWDTRHKLAEIVDKHFFFIKKQSFYVVCEKLEESTIRVTDGPHLQL